MGRVGAANEYIDWLAKVDEVGGELAWVTRQKNFPLNTSQKVAPVRRSADEIIRCVLDSKRVKKTINAEAERRGCAQKVVRAEAEEVIRTMAHRMQMPAVRLIGYAIVSVVKRLFDGIFVNSVQLQRLRELFNNDAVIFMPTHRTYMDFLLISLLCFDHDVPLPAIAAGMDFMNSKFMGEALRRCGAFFIRREFGKDRLYWSLFTEYVQTHLINADHPVEFFIEGTRSRSGKSLYPRYGLLQILVEPFLRCQLYDMVIVPVTMNYDKILEEALYAYELLGFPKPKESTTGLLKARRILNKRFGRVYMTFGEPISVRRYFSTSLERSAFACQPESVFEVPVKEKMVIRKFGHDIVRIHNENNVISIWPYTCAVLLKLLDERRMSNRNELVPLGELVHYVEEIIALAKRLEKNVLVHTNIINDLRYYLELHSDLFCTCDNFASPDSNLQLSHFLVSEQNNIDKHCLERSVAHIILSNYANQVLYDFADMGLICSILIAKNQIDRNDAMSLFCRLHALFDHEFVCMPGKEEAQASFAAAIGTLQRGCCIDLSDEIVTIKCNGAVMAMASLIHPFIAVYQLVIQTVFGFAGTTAAQSLLVVGTQRRVAQLLASPDHKYLRSSALSSDPIKNALSSLCSHKALVKQADGQYRVDAAQLCSVGSLLNSRTFSVLSMHQEPFASSFVTWFFALPELVPGIW
ncbi:unnamed protein product [Toxocara canis]|uniref:PlsC domain-containing protein n=1 Tax=Toxocara canis TaxID=6265 RepID=A0A183UH77_TOXCA|nr:unnamed protein product [Toxocara canis]